ncbi:MAG: DUF4249 family protein [Saprospiraceae bacterium]|nr:DUF4249 family protein [Saprospiraceae bacterium]
MRTITRVLIIIILFTGCLEDITLKDQRFETQAVIIQGRLAKGSPSLVEVNVRRIGDFDGFEADVHISGAKVFLVNDDGTSIQLTEELINKRYRAFIPENNPSFKVETGRSYHLEISLLNGNQYASIPEPLLPVPKIDKTDFDIVELTELNEEDDAVTREYVRTQVGTPLKSSDAEEKARLRWELFADIRLTDDPGNICYYPEPLRSEQIFIYNGETFGLERLDTFPLADVLLNYRFAEGFYVTFVQESLSKGAFTYWNQVKTLAERNGNMFDPPAGKVSSNVKNIKDPKEEVFGYFYATEQDTVRQYIRPEEVGFPQTYCPLPPPRTPLPGPTFCDDCLLRSNSSLIKPVYWIE